MRDEIGHRARLLARDRVVVQHMQRIARLRHVNARDIAPGAADGIEIAALEPRRAAAMNRDIRR